MGGFADPKDLHAKHSKLITNNCTCIPAEAIIICTLVRRYKKQTTLFLSKIYVPTTFYGPHWLHLCIFIVGHICVYYLILVNL